MVEINGQQYQHATSKFIASATSGQFPTTTVKSCEYKVTAAKKATTDAQGRVDGFTIDKAEHSGSISMKYSEWVAFKNFLLRSNPLLGVLQCQFDFSVSYGQSFNGLTTDVLHTCMLNEEARKSDDSQEPDMVELPIFFMDALFNGRPAIVYDAF